jgi:hypothetical protein
MTTRRVLNFVCQRKSFDGIMESHFIRDVLLARPDRPVRIFPIEDKMQPPFLDDTLLLSLGVGGGRYLQAARAKGVKNLGLLHMGDELGDHDRSMYVLADYVIRNYWFEHVFTQPHENSLGVIWVPNGYMNGVGPIAPGAILDMADRWCMGFFAGGIRSRTLSSERERMLQVVEDANIPFTTFAVKLEQRLGPLAYAGWLTSSRFALVPGGNSPETVRLYDALEAGAIPIMLKSRFVHEPDALNDPPFILLDSWDQLPAAYAPYADAKSPATIAALQEKQRQVLAWWGRFKERQRNKVQALLDKAFEKFPVRPAP